MYPLFFKISFFMNLKGVWDCLRHTIDPNVSYNTGYVGILYIYKKKTKKTKNKKKTKKNTEFD